MDRQQREALLTEAQRLRGTLVDASVKLATFTEQLRDLLDLTDDGTPDNEEEHDER